MNDLHRNKSSDKLIKNKFFELLSGKSFENKSFTDLAPFYCSLFFCVIIIYINNSYRVERYIRYISHLETELKDLRAEYITTKSQLMFQGKQTEVQKLVITQGLEVSKTALLSSVRKINESS